MFSCRTSETNGGRGDGESTGSLRIPSVAPSQELTPQSRRSLQPASLESRQLLPLVDKLGHRTARWGNHRVGRPLLRPTSLLPTLPSKQFASTSTNSLYLWCFLIGPTRHTSPAANPRPPSN